MKPEKNLFPRKRFLTVVTACQTAIQGETETQTVVGQWWGSSGTGPHLEQGCLDAHILGLYLLLLQDPEDRLKRFSGSLSPSSQCGHIE